jgi:TonB family protein
MRLTAIFAVLLLSTISAAAQSLPDAPSAPAAPTGFGKAARGVSNSSTSVTVTEAEALSHVLTRPLQAYPPAASVNKVEGDVVVEATIDTNGDVSAAKAISGRQIFAPAAVAFVKQWIFRPFYDGATRVPAVTQLTVRYSLFASQTERDMEQHFLQTYWPAWNAGEAALAKSDFETASKQYGVARDEAAKLGQANWQELANALARLGAVQYRQKNYPAAEPFLLQALQVQQAHREPDAPEIADALGNLGQLYMAENEFGKAEPILLKSVEIYDAHLQDPKASPLLLAGYKKHRVLNLFMLGSLNQEMGSGDDAVKYCDMAVGDAPRSMNSADAVLVIRTCETVYKKNLKFSKSRAAENAAQALEQPVSPQK